MYKKLCLISLLSLASISAYSAEQLHKEADEPLTHITHDQLLARIHGQDLHGNTLLHIAALSPQEIDANYPNSVPSLSEPDPIYDTIQAHAVAWLICLNADVNKANSKSITPLCIAHENRERFPKTYEVMLAGWIVQRSTSPIPLSIDDFLRNPKEAVAQCIETAKTYEAIKTIERYAETTEPTEQKN